MNFTQAESKTLRIVIIVKPYIFYETSEHGKQNSSEPDAFWLEEINVNTLNRPHKVGGQSQES